MKSVFEQMGGAYKAAGDYFIHDLLSPDNKENHIGKYGRMRQHFLKENHEVIYTVMLLNGTLFEHLAEIDTTCNERVDKLVSLMTRQEGISEALKSTDQMKWVRCMNSIRNRAEEMVLSELVYA